MNPDFRYHVRKLLGPVFGTLRTRILHHSSMELCARHVRALGFYPKTIFDIGVFQGTYELYNTWPDARLILVDPLKESEAAMKYICAHRRAPASYILAAAGNRDGETRFHSFTDMAASSMVSGSGEQVVPMYTLDSLDTMFKGVSPYLLKIDVQGAEALVLSGASTVLPLCEVVMLETALFDFERTGITLPEMMALMKSKGFVPFDIYDGLCRSLDGSLGLIDIAFVKADGRFRQSHLWGTERQNARRRGVARLRKMIGL
jgi:FkbM family methyltransferase